jgi:hypothetical protein
LIFPQCLSISSWVRFVSSVPPSSSAGKVYGDVIWTQLLPPFLLLLAAAAAACLQDENDEYCHIRSQRHLLPTIYISCMPRSKHDHACWVSRSVLPAGVLYPNETTPTPKKRAYLTYQLSLSLFLGGYPSRRTERTVSHGAFFHTANRELIRDSNVSTHGDRSSLASQSCM